MFVIQLCSIIYVTFLIIIYSFKKQINKLVNQNYKYLLLFTITILIVDILALFGINHYPNLFIVEILTKAVLSGTIAWLSTFTFYIMYSESKTKELTFIRAVIKYRKVKIITIITFFIAGVIFGLPIEYTNNPLTVKGLAFKFFGLATILYLVLDTYYIIKNEGNIHGSRRISIILFTFIIYLAITLCYINTTTLFISFGLSLIVVFMYFTVESPENKYIVELNILKEKAESANRAKTDFLTSMSHEIRTPMNAIVGITESLLNSNIPINVKNDLKNVDEASHILLEIINNILDISKVESGKLEVINSDYSLVNSIKEINVLIKSRIGIKPIKFNIEINNNIPKIINGDETKVIQILLNILNNAVKYTDEGFINLKINCKTNANYAYFTFIISDSGKGIKEEDYDKVFQKFIRLDSVNNRSIEGTGLGLALTKNLVDLLGGKISFSSEYGKGTTFTIELSQKVIDATFSDINSISLSDNNDDDQISYFNGSAYKILVVDDNKLNLKVIEKILAPYNFNVSFVSSGADCLKYTLTNNYDLIFLDHMMPEMNGIQVLHKLRERVVLESIPIIVLTANAVDGMKEMYLKEGFTDYISKPIDRNKLHNMLLKYLNIKKD